MKTKNKKFSAIITIALAIILALGTLALTGCGGSGTDTAAPEEEGPEINPLTGIEAEGELPARPVIVSIPNAPDGAIPQSNISYADMIYEFPVEGQLTRIQAIYMTEFPDKVGPIRSVRYYFVDLCREYKAAHVGYGWGKKAHKYMDKCNIPHINGMQDTQLFYRVEDKSAPNDAYINWEDIQKRADSEGWFKEKQNIKPFKFRDEEWEAAKAEAQKVIDEKSESTDEADVKEVEKAKTLLAEPKKASSVKVSSTGCNSECKYNEETGLYDRYWYGEPYVDKETGKQLSFSNVIVQYVTSDIMVDEDTGLQDEKGRLEINMAEGGKAVLFTNGECIEGTWSREDLGSRTIYKDSNGRQFRLTPGKTWVYIVDQNLSCSYE